MGETYRSGQSVTRLARPKVIALALATLALLIVTATALAATGDLTQPAGTAGCVSEDGTGPCTDGHALTIPESVAVSPDGKSVYLASNGSSAVVRLNRNTSTGAISQPAGAAGCVSEFGNGPCADGHALQGLFGVAVSPDGESVYVASQFSDAVALFNRNPTTGAISQPPGTAGCVSDEGTGPCANGHALDGASSVAVSADGKSVYVASQSSDAVARFNRNMSTGAISQPDGGCISESGAGGCADGHGLNGATYVVVSPDGKSVYATSLISDAVARLNRNATNGVISQPPGTAGCVSRTGSGPCADGHALRGPSGVAVSPDGESIYVASASSDAVARFNRSTSTGAISQPAGTAGCVSETGAGTCADGRALDGAGGVAVSPDGKNVYVASAAVTPSDAYNGALARLNRSTTTGAISQPAGTAGCVSETGFGLCANGHGLETALWVAVSADGGNVYVASAGSSAVARFNRAP